MYHLCHCLWGAWNGCTTSAMVCGGLVGMYHLCHGSWGLGTSIPLVPWFGGSCASVPLLPWFVGALDECTTCAMVRDGLERVYHLFNGLWGTGTILPLVPWFVRAW